MSDDDGPRLDPDIERYYDIEWEEDDRLRNGLGQLELVRTQELVRRHLPPGSHRILDVGGGGGVHAEWLVEDGHAVHLVDPVPRHVEQAMARLGGQERFSGAVGDARKLDAEDGSFDAVFLFGPLYHLIEPADRAATWDEATRVCRPGGMIFAAAISRFASLISGLASGAMWMPDFREIVYRDLADGQHRNALGRDYFTTAFFHHPDELRREAETAGIDVVDVFGVEGVAGAMPHLERDWEDAERRAEIIEAARAIETEPSLLGVGPHILLVGTVHRE